MSEINLYVALIHYPVINKKGVSVGSALTTIDLHDIARASATFGVKGFYVVTPYQDQIELARELISHWTCGKGGVINPDRKQALRLIRLAHDFDQTIGEIEEECGKPVVAVATSAKETGKGISLNRLQHQLKNKAPHLLVFGTAWGLAKELIDRCDHILEPITGNTEYNHLSVRSAASIYLDRIINDR